MAVIKNMEKWEKEIEEALDFVFGTKRISGVKEIKLALFGERVPFNFYNPILVWEKEIEYKDYKEIYVEVSHGDGTISIFNENDLISIIPVKNKLSALCRMIETVTLALQNNEQKTEY